MLPQKNKQRDNPLYKTR